MLTIKRSLWGIVYCLLFQRRKDNFVIMNKNLIFTLFCVFVFFSCAENKKVQVFDIPVLKVSDLETVESIELYDTNYFDKVEFIKLETTDESILGEISQIEIFENHIYILDRKGRSLKKFDLAGKYLHDIGRVGLGTEEYNTVTAFYINPNLKTINIYDPLKSSVLQYDFSGKYIKTTKSGDFALTFAERLSFIDDNEIFCLSDANWEANCEFSILNEKFNKVKCIYEYPVKTDKQISSRVTDHPYTVRNGEIHYVLTLSDTIYSYSNNEISKRLLIESGKPTVELKQLSQIASEGDNVFITTIFDVGKKGYSMGLKNFFESDSYICCDFYEYADNHIIVAAILWNKTTNEGVYLSEYAFAPSPCFGSISYCFDNTFVKIWEGQQIHGFKEYVKTGFLTKEQYPAKVWEILDNYNEDDDNPILIFYTMKK
jgi:hypothetical protein